MNVDEVRAYIKIALAKRVSTCRIRMMSWTANT
jgi:hypothetical protein